MKSLIFSSALVFASCTSVLPFEVSRTLKQIHSAAFAQSEDVIESVNAYDELPFKLHKKDPNFVFTPTNVGLTHEENCNNCKALNADNAFQCDFTVYCSPEYQNSCELLKYKCHRCVRSGHNCINDESCLEHRSSRCPRYYHSATQAAWLWFTSNTYENFGIYAKRDGDVVYGCIDEEPLDTNAENCCTTCLNEYNDPDDCLFQNYCVHAYANLLQRKNLRRSQTEKRE